MTGTIIVNDRNILCRLHCRRISTPANLPGISRIFAELKLPAILGGNSSVTGACGFSYWTAEPREIFEFRKGQKNPFEKLHRILSKYKLDESAADFDLPKGIFCGGWVGFFSYELGRYIEKLPATTTDDIDMPLIRLCFYDRLISYDHIEKTFRLIALQMPGDSQRPSEKLDFLERLLKQSADLSVPQPAPADFDKRDLAAVRCNMDKDYYLQAFKKIKQYIYDGEVYQINFSRRFESAFDAEAIDLFCWQNHYNPSPYAVYIDGGDFHIVSASPEMYITIADGSISTKPIKGTRPRIDEAGADAVNYNELVSSEKEQAELNMIIDLERNDVARICVPGTRKVIRPRTIEQYPTVFHAVATIAGRLRDDITFSDILKAMFPGGSITGAPKIRSMEIIDETEPTARGVYTGSIGFLGIDGGVCLNIAIRTIIIKNRKAYAQTGGGIVADSDAEAEWQETIVKARALLAGINSVMHNVSCNTKL
ncbi:MAG: anthranilate synthase component I family protein [Sedimentisphaerales bacterium]|nr:anthranilate synthase component I family protein [Sedimentisphaerales bacterium]